MKRFVGYAFKIVFSRTLIVFLMILMQALFILSSIRWLGSYMPYIWELINLLGALLILYIINRDEPSEFKISWIIPICAFPVFGALIYIFVISNAGGIGLKTKMGIRMKETEGMLYTARETEEVIDKCPEYFKGFAHYMECEAGYPAYHNSTAVYYPLGEDKFKDLLLELKKAKRYIFLEYFIVGRGVMWDSILAILKEKVKEGVEVRVMYDGMCSIVNLPYHYPEELRSYGIKAKMFAPIRPFLSTSQNNRDHRKILVIDGKTAFTGGVNLADEYINEIELYGHWKDVSVKITGDAVRSFTVMFLQMWNLSEKGSEKYEKYLQDIEYETPLSHDGFVIPYGETPTMKKEVAKTVYQSIINSAVKYVHIMTPYFIVEREFTDSMCFAAERGVEVSMILPHIPDKKIAYYIARTYYPALLAAGVRIYEYTPGFIHAKVMVSDDITATIGTINMDYRSFYHHFECGAYFYGNKVVGKAEEDFQNTLHKCQEVTISYYQKIPFYQKLIGKVFKIFAPLM